MCGCSLGASWRRRCRRRGRGRRWIRRSSLVRVYVVDFGGEKKRRRGGELGVGRPRVKAPKF